MRKTNRDGKEKSANQGIKDQQNDLGKSLKELETALNKSRKKPTASKKRKK